ncbi:MAG: L-serine ammonia-lyase, iron-sulfur-dependent, subunit alpha [Lachnospiraceae bacterium]
MDQKQFQELHDILRKETKPALGCTGPIGSCFLAAQAYDAIGGEIEKIIVYQGSPKSDDVAFPGTEMLGAEMAYALGAVCGDPNAGLEVLHTVTPEGELKARKVAELVEMRVDTQSKTLGGPRRVDVITDKGVGTAVAQGAQDGLIYKARNEEVLLDIEPDALNRAGDTPLMKYKIRDFYEFATTCPIEDLDFMLDTAQMNTEMSDYVLEHEGVGINIGKGLLNVSNPTPATRAKAAAAAACEGRMSGVNLPIMSVGGKGNVGIASTMPIVSLAKDYNIEQEQLQRALALSCLLATAVIHRIGKAPTMCSCEVAATMGVAAGTVLLRGGTEEQVENAIQNLIPNVFGVVCDGAKLACALRMASGTGMAIDAAELALNGVRLANNQGVLDKNADASIDFLGDFALHAMVESNNRLTEKMMEKRKIFPLMTLKDRQEW